MRGDRPFKLFSLLLWGVGLGVVFIYASLSYKDSKEALFSKLGKASDLIENKFFSYSTLITDQIILHIQKVSENPSTSLIQANTQTNIKVSLNQSNLTDIFCGDSNEILFL